MCVYQTRMRNVAAILVTVLLLAASASAETNGSAVVAKVRIKNFGRINDNYYRGAQPDGRDYADLAAAGIKTVIDLTRDGRSDEQGLVERAGMKFYRIPLTTSDRPSAAAVTQFLKLVNDPANLPVYVHCQGGRHRTGAMTAVYRMTKDGWNAERAYQEMKQYNFEGFPGHPELKRFVYDYYAQLDRDQQRRADLEQTEKGVAISK
jgi:protein tyrosine/serine phosphatase